MASFNILIQLSILLNVYLLVISYTIKAPLAPRKKIFNDTYVSSPHMSQISAMNECPSNINDLEQKPAPFVAGPLPSKSSPNKLFIIHVLPVPLSPIKMSLILFLSSIIFNIKIFKIYN